MNKIAESFYDYKLDKWGDPQSYKDVELYPIKITDEDMHNDMYSLLCRAKDVTKEKDILKSSYLKFLVYFVHPAYQNSEDEVTRNYDVIETLMSFMSKVTQETCAVHYKYLKEVPETSNDIKFYLLVGDKKLTETDFDNIREMILYQNGTTIEYVNEYNEDLEEKMAIANRNNKSANFEEQLFSFCSAMSITIDKIRHYTFYQFLKHFERVKIKLEFELFKPLESSGQIEIKNGTISHWLDTLPDKGRYGSILVKKSDFEKNNDVMQVSGKK